MALASVLLLPNTDRSRVGPHKSVDCLQDFHLSSIWFNKSRSWVRGPGQGTNWLALDARACGQCWCCLPVCRERLCRRARRKGWRATRGRRSRRRRGIWWQTAFSVLKLYSWMDKGLKAAERSGIAVRIKCMERTVARVRKTGVDNWGEAGPWYGFCGKRYSSLPSMHDSTYWRRPVLATTL